MNKYNLLQVSFTPAVKPMTVSLIAYWIESILTPWIKNNLLPSVFWTKCSLDFLCYNQHKLQILLEGGPRALEYTLLQTQHHM